MVQKRNSYNSLEERILRLENQVSKIVKILENQIVKESLPTETKPLIKPKPEVIAKRISQKRDQIFPDHMRSVEYWFSKIGIGLLLFGIVFLFKYSVDQGWLTPWVRIILGIFAGLLLNILGLRTHLKNRHFAQVLFGGGIAAWYITGFAAFQVLDLVSHTTAFIFMVGVTLFSFFLALQQKEAVLSIIGTIGGLGTPFLLYTGQSNIAGLMGYSCLILATTSAITFFKGWRSLLWTSVIGGWLIFWIGLESGRPFGENTLFLDKISLQLAILFGWVFFWAVPLIRQIFAALKPERWSFPSIDYLKNRFSPDLFKALEHPIYTLTLSTPLIALLMSSEIWDWKEFIWGWIVLGSSFIYGGCWWFLNKKDPLKKFASVHGIVFLILFTFSFTLLLDGNALLFVLAGEAAILHLLSKKLKSNVLSIIAHILYGLVGLWLMERLLNEGSVGIIFINLQAFTDFWVILLLFLVSYYLTSSSENLLYKISSHIFFLILIYREMVVLLHGQGLISITWGVYGILLLIIALRVNSKQLRLIAICTLLLVVGKLFLVDLSQLETIWRVLLFLGFGTVFMVISYYFPKLWKSG